VVKKLEAEASLRTVLLYIDGFKVKGRKEAGWVVSVWKDGRKVEAFSGKLGYVEVFDAEVVALAVGLNVAAAEERALVFTDS